MVTWKKLNLLKNLLYWLKVNETIKNEAEERKGIFFSMSLGTLAAILLGNLLSGKWVIWAGEEQ